ncbi:MAG TPA: FAD-binding oxidoreductase [Allocoleopsis sp.]
MSIFPEQILSQIPTNVLKGIENANLMWQNIKNNNITIPDVVKYDQNSLENIDFDVIICGGTLGILIGASLAKLGWKVALLEKGILRGREQEWNISRQELQVFLELELLTERELEGAIASEYNPGRVGFLGGKDIWVKDILNIGVDPVYLLETLKLKFLDWGGKLLENSPFTDCKIHPNGVLINGLTTRLLIDAMGNFSPISQQVRKREKPEGICLVVGSCATGFTNNNTGDLIYTFTPIENQCQYFWEAFPARDGRTTYLFTYMDAHPERFSLQFFLSEYFRLLPEYQQIELDKITLKRTLFGFFPAYKNSPLKMPFERILSIGDSSGSQSPVSFGGFGAMVRHLKRLTTGINDALKWDCLSQKDLLLLQPYQPNISVTWMFQKAMSVKVNQKINPQQINNLLSAIFEVMENLGDDVLNPFLQDVIQFSGLSKTLAIASLKPHLVLPIIPQVGILTLLDWLIHYINLGTYNSLYPLGKMSQNMILSLPDKQRYYYQRLLESWEYGSGQ